MEKIIFEIEVSANNRYLSFLRDQGLLFDRIREALNLNEDELKEISFIEYELLNKSRNLQ